MIIFKISIPFCLLSLALCDIGAGQNQYLPPSKGYQYDKPSITFSTPTRPPRPPTPTRPYQPPTQPPYRPPPSPTPTRPTYGPPPTQPPTYRPSPPTQPPYRPPPPPSRPPTRPTYVPPPPPTRPPYSPPPPPVTRPPTRPTYIPPSTPTRPPVRPPTPTRPPYVGGESGVVGSGIGRPEEHDHHDHHHHEPGMPFDFTYQVNDVEHGNDYSHNAISDGDVTRGEYRIKLPDGRTQVVKYTADWKHGFNAEVSFEGTPEFPAFNIQGSATDQDGYRY